MPVNFAMAAEHSGRGRQAASKSRKQISASAVGAHSSPENGSTAPVSNRIGLKSAI
jgi:hypothetical protein